ncbi:hypothetical protein G3545_18495 [Starkeya sp. ORNL1]|uniref:hypothetical protein n=1 Tax=Starkeya sp. ORNL1 TaxID=2709380 RepID=UPI001463AFCB|nr:hypothetical protein [Starkeya sp. ORNL1]QJP15466.1 hypothetical protein G3545_18495 [Starkeya sp. ORNL1]
MAGEHCREFEGGNRAGLVAEEPTCHVLAHAAGGETGTVRAGQADALAMLVIMASRPAGAISGRCRQADQQENKREPSDFAAACRGASVVMMGVMRP